MRTKKVTQISTKSLKNKLEQYAFGYTLTETVSEYNIDENGVLKLVKQKKSEKLIPPDVSLIKILYDLDDNKGGFENMTDEELEAEKQKIIKSLNDGENHGTKT